MAVHIQLPTNPKATVPFKPAFDGDRAALLARRAAQLPGAVVPPTPLPPVVAAAAAPAANELPAGEAPASEALLEGSSAPGRIRAVALVLKFTLVAAMLLGGAFGFLRFVMPVIKELQQPTPPPAAGAKADAPTAVRMLQETRAVVAKNDANVAYLNSIVDPEAEAKKAAATPVVPAATPVAEARPSAAPNRQTTGRITADACRAAVERLVIGRVMEGPEPRILLNGLLVKRGEIIDRALALRFMGVDAYDNVLLFTNAENEVFRKRY